MKTFNKGCDSLNMRIWITSAYRNKNGSKGQLLNIEDTSSPQPTPEASFDSNATKIIIHKSDEKINTLMLTIPNIPNDEVPDGDTDEDNVEIRKF